MDLYNELRSGRTAEEIATAFTEALNAAEARIKAEEAAEAARRHAEEEAARALAETTKAAKREEMTAMVDEALHFCATYYPELGLKENDWTQADAAVFADLLLLLLDIEAAKPIKRKLEMWSKPKVEIEKFTTASGKEAMRAVPVEKSASATEDVFAKFFEEFGL